MTTISVLGGTIRGKLIVAFASTLILLLGSIASATTTAFVVRQDFHQTVNDDRALAADVSVRQGQMAAQYRDVIVYLVERDPAALIRYRVSGRRVAALERRTPVTGSTSTSTLLNQLAARERAWRLWAGHVLAHPPAMGDSAAIERSVAAGGLLQESADSTTNHLAAIIAHDQKRGLAGAQHIQDMMEAWLITMLLAAALAFILLGRKIAQAVTRPLAVLSASADAIGSGDLSRPVPIVGTSEFRSLATHLDAMRRQLAAEAEKREALTEELRYQAVHDPLTGLPNRTLFLDRLGQAIASSERHRWSVAVLLMDLDRFKEINDTFGHHYGDLLLQQIKPRLIGALRGSDTVARLGGDEFGILLPQTDRTGAEEVATKLTDSLLESFEVEGQMLEIGGSVGISVYPDHGPDAETLLRRADIAMYRAKNAQTGIDVYTADIDTCSPKRLTLLSELRRAIELDQLSLHYQPKVDMTSGKMHGVEVLSRWRHPEHGFVPPDEFIPIAEVSGLINPLTAWALSTALVQARIWSFDDMDIGVAVNLSARSLTERSLETTIKALLESTGVEPSRLTLEITETALMTDAERGEDMLSRLRDLGVRLSIDDFGTGYSSLSRLSRLSIDEVKIDRSFVGTMTTDPASASIVSSVIHLSHDLGLHVVAEGVEDRETWDALVQLGCDTAQGFLISRPVPAHDFLRWAHQDRRNSVA